MLTNSRVTFYAASLDWHFIDGNTLLTLHALSLLTSQVWGSEFVSQHNSRSGDMVSEMQGEKLFKWHLPQTSRSFHF